MKITAYTFLIILLYTISACLPKKDLETRFKKHIKFLASDSLEGREAGTENEKLAARYIKEVLESAEIQPKGENGDYYQDFEFLVSKTPSENSSFTIGGAQINNENFYPLNFSGNDTISGNVVNAGYGIEAPDLKYSDYEKMTDADGKIFLISISSPDGIHPHSAYVAYHDLKLRAKKAAEKGAIGVIFYNNDPKAKDPEKDYNRKVTPVDIPVVFLDDSTIVEKLTEENVSIAIEMVEENRTGRNVIGWINNNAEQFAVFGAHYDHLGFGQGGNSLYRGQEPSIHNGADDNASGTAMMIELARALKNSELNGYNFVFIAFSGEELGLLGSNYFTDHPTYDLSKTSYMFNMDMVGRLDTADMGLSIMGTGTSPVWDTLISNTESELEISKSASGVGPTDFTSFYLKDIPVLGFFTGTHEDYHKPGDDYDKINYAGMTEIHDLIMNFNRKLNSVGELAFTKTRDSNSRSVPDFKVTLGIIPDYIFNGKGLKIDGVTEGGPASKSGIKQGDIIIRMGKFEIDDIYAYMDALSNFNKGQEVQVILKRGDNRKEVQVNF